ESVFEEQPDLCSWGTVLNRLDEAFEKSLTASPSLILVPRPEKKVCYDDTDPPPTSTLQGVDDSSDAVEVVTACLRFTSLLLHHSINKHVYSSTEYLIQLLAARDDTMAMLALECLTALAVPPMVHRQQLVIPFNRAIGLAGDKELSSKLTALSRGWGGRGQGMGLLNCVVAEDSALALPSSELLFEYTPGDGEGIDSSAKAVMKLPIPTTAREAASTSAAAIFDELTKQEQVPANQEFVLLLRIRMALGFLSRPQRCLAIKRRLLALLCFIHSHHSTDLLLSYFQAQPELTQELVELVCVQMDPAKRELVPLVIRTLAIQCLAALVSCRGGGGGSGLGMVARTTNVFQELGVARSQYTGLLPSLLRYAVAQLGRISSSDSATGAAASSMSMRDTDLLIGMAFVEAAQGPGKGGGPEQGMSSRQQQEQLKAQREQLEWVETLLCLVHSVAAVQTGAAALVECGLIPAMLNVVQLHVDSLKRSGQARAPFRWNFVVSLAVQVVETCVANNSSAQSAFRELNAAEVLVTAFYEQVAQLLVKKPKEVEARASDAAAAAGKGKGKAKEGIGEGDASEAAAAAAGAAAAAEGDNKVLPPSPSQKSLLYSLLNGLSVAFHSQGMAHTMGSTHLRRPPLTLAIVDVFNNVGAFGGVLVALAATLMSELINSDPTCVRYVHSSGIAAAYMRALAGPSPIPASAEFILAIPAVISSLALTTAGAEAVKKAGLFPAIFSIFSSPQYVLPASRCLQGELTMVMGSGLDELMRHVPVLKGDCLSEFVTALKKVAAEGRELHDGECYALGSSAEAERYRFVQYVAHMAELTDASLTKSEHAGPLFDQGGVDAILEMYRLALPAPRSFLAQASCVANNSTQNLSYYPAAHALSAALKNLGSQGPAKLMVKAVEALESELSKMSQA
ncbi:unnamed protein product, partial [Chrysoparadoxa australica]